MRRNIEIKVRLKDIEAMTRRVRAIVGGEPEVLNHEDVYFAVGHGRLKLRIIDGKLGQLIGYRRPDETAPKMSQYHLFEIDKPDEMRALLESTHSIRCIVKKTRVVYMSGRTRIHIDDVAGLGHFLELEAVMAENEADDTQARHEIADLMDVLEIEQEDLVGRSYVDLCSELSK